MPALQATQLTRDHRRELVLLAGVIGREVEPRVRAADVEDIDRWWRRNRSGIEEIVVDGFETAATLAQQFLIAHAAIEGASLAPLDVDVDTDQIVNGLRITGPVSFKKHLTISSSTDAALRIMTKRTAASAKRLALGGSRRTILDTIDQSPVIVGYRRVTASNPCDFCQMLAVRGAVYRSSAAAGFVGANGRVRGTRRVGQSYHDSCRCTIQPLYDTDLPAGTF